MPINYSLLFGDAASQTFPATAAGTYTLSTPLAAGLYEITTDTSQSSFTLGIQTADGYRFTGTIRGGKGYISVAATSTKIVIPAGMTYPANINLRLGSYTMMAAPTSVSSSFPVSGVDETVVFTAPSGSTDIVAYWRNGSSTAFSSTTSPKTLLTNPTITANGQTGHILLVAKDANGVTGLGVETVSTNTATYFPITGGTITTYSSGGTSYVVNTFTGSGTLVVNTICNIDYLVVAGGGGAATAWGGGGGGGAGGYLTGTHNSVSVGSKSVVVGSGGAGSNASATQASNGQNSSIALNSTITATGGGGAGEYGGVNNSGVPGRSGGSGGGSALSYGGGNVTGGSGTAGQGNNGGTGQQYGTNTGGGGGGGGAGAVGANAYSSTTGGVMGNGGNGGVGLQSSITGTSTYYAGGGGGGGSGTAGKILGVGGLGGGGNASYTSPHSGSLGVANTGGGAGPNDSGNAAKSNGGSGIVIVRTVLS